MEVVESQPESRIPPRGVQLLPLKNLQNGKPAKLTPEIVAEVADSVAAGLPLRLALSLCSQYVTETSWNQGIANSTKLRLLFEQKIAQWVFEAVKSIAGKNSKELPVGSCWLLERRLPEYFSLNKSTSQVNVNVNVAGLADDVVRRAASLVKRRPDPATIIDVESKPVKTPKRKK